MNYRAELLANGLIRVRSSSGLVGLYERDGSYRSGDLRLSRRVASALLCSPTFGACERCAVTR